MVRKHDSGVTGSPLIYLCYIKYRNKGVGASNDIWGCDKEERKIENFPFREMSDEDLSTYKLQLQQVEAALTTDPTNEV